MEDMEVIELEQGNYCIENDDIKRVIRSKKR